MRRGLEEHGASFEIRKWEPDGWTLRNTAALKMDEIGGVFNPARHLEAVFFWENGLS